MKRLLLVPALGVVGLVLASPASAQLAGTIDLNRQTYTDEARQPYNESRRVAYDNGYREGIKEGERDGRSRDAFNYQDERTWQRADKGYHRSFGDSGRYQQSFRTGYSNGYSDGYRRYAPDSGYGRTAYPSNARRLSDTRSGTLSQPVASPRWDIHRDRAATVPRSRAATATARRIRTARTTATKRAARTQAIATRTTRCATSGSAKATTTTRAQYGPRSAVRERLSPGVPGRVRPRLSGVGVSAVAVSSISGTSSSGPETSPGHRPRRRSGPDSRIWVSSARRVTAARPICSTAFGSAAPSALNSVGVELEHGGVAARDDRRRSRHRPSAATSLRSSRLPR